MLNHWPISDRPFAVAARFAGAMSHRDSACLPAFHVLPPMHGVYGIYEALPRAPLRPPSGELNHRDH
jgi:hypothetical protein